MRINRVASGGWTWAIQVTDGTSTDELQEAKANAIALNQDLLDHFYPEPEEPDF